MFCAGLHSRAIAPPRASPNHATTRIANLRPIIVHGSAPPPTSLLHRASRIDIPRSHHASHPKNSTGVEHSSRDPGGRDEGVTRKFLAGGPSAARKTPANAGICARLGRFTNKRALTCEGNRQITLQNRYVLTASQRALERHLMAVELPIIQVGRLRFIAPAYALRPRRVARNPIIRSLVPPARHRYLVVFERLGRALLPWDVWNYPGIQRGITEVYGGRVSYATIKHWRFGTRPVPVWAGEIIIAYARQRVAALTAAADEMEAMLRMEAGSQPLRGQAATRARRAKRRKRAMTLAGGEREI